MIDLHGYLPFILRGFAVTVEVALLSLLIAIVLGIGAAAAQLSSSKIARLLAVAYSTLIRGVPDLVLMTLVFFGGQILLNRLGDAMGWEYIDVDPFVSGVLTIGFIFGAYMSETFRGAILAVPRGEIEAGRAFGMSGFTLFVRIILPASARHALPGFGNNWLVLAKTTALVSVIGLHDMVHNAAQAGGAVREPFTFYFVVALLFLALTSVSELLLKWTSQRVSAGVRRV
ncbi:MAG: His/Glu/Gln/Arg/opine family amino acid ABC transporter permease subunit [Gammaproteobacteria bacterium]